MILHSRVQLMKTEGGMLKCIFVKTPFPAFCPLCNLHVHGDHVWCQYWQCFPLSSCKEIMGYKFFMLLSSFHSFYWQCLSVSLLSKVLQPGCCRMLETEYSYIELNPPPLFFVAICAFYTSFY